MESAGPVTKAQPVQGLWNLEMRKSSAIRLGWLFCGLTVWVSSCTNVPDSAAKGSGESFTEHPPHPAVVGRVVVQGVDVGCHLFALHARQVRVLNYLETATEQLHPNSKLGEPKTRGLNEHNQGTGCETRERRQSALGIVRIELEERGFWASSPVALGNQGRQLRLGVVHHQGRLARGVLEAHLEDPPHVLRGQRTGAFI